ncbi:hypothetical protein A3K48_04525 [candidate division WOR-1 bacterium RIFOXYA12_FULL_52_29]|uniref:Uncharacterized protein n=1 Tax=candidate division WOR-1 bacterium RIFOXYC12_FULL_54_18 TaxID=1802584 RepID=A0A1F4T5Z0_UNCSA|nr:MAG: hypothetical protein A3K44_04525 [candidate division WOR-1 bacterium RIFOXYA2_FULL_51_19]OGC17814.1 MAG: hypothetical protein A3K48_04525 [candidate division WOR-1 bacterium RIFOXYA12_FULL_52_29]OGC26671.1 MAG: hypothetical protein A3K32_04520 [candidate division WOR-1 bacterium RIFOXYB2_FULL_45_9]OGC28231.1 MAG: hypothetical protein A3K49_04525 [candidate division WOR-1 bacterium RIFOXYC12_FULL_54_18]OGC29481.1 MAG: hypothetical protein A2346_01810 [candidate division WOR-1 bacterium R
MSEEKSALEKLEESLKEFWRQSGQASVIAAKHTEFVIEPKVFMGDKLNPEILKLLVLNYLTQTSRQDSGIGNIEVATDKLIIKSPKGKPLVIVNDQRIVQQYINSRQ